MLKKNLPLLCTYFAAILLVAGACLGFEVYRFFYQPMPLQNNESVIFRIDKSTSATTFVRALQSQRLIHSGRLFLAFIRLQGLSKHLKAGVYQVKQGESAEQLLQRVVSGDVLTEPFRIIEGTTQQQIACNLARASYLSYQKSDWNAVLPLQSDIIGLGESVTNPEGLFLADTYQYNAGSDAKALLSQAHGSLKQYLLQSWQQRDPVLLYKNPYELLIVASILEKEAALPEERRLISGIIVNRLSHNMPLQMDPTVIYAIGSAYTGKLTHDDLQIDSPYNTYRYRGLPPTPITTVGKDAIDAASHPHRTNYFYFVAKGDGTHVFSETYEQQRQAIDTYVRKHS